jgi:Primase C terminal 2 (PriCT-2)/Family of unknown function (DUF5906)
MTSDRHSVLDTYKNLGWSLVSGDMSYDAVREKKKFTHHSVGGWAERPVMRCDASGYAMLTGEISGITAIDIDDVRPEHNRKLSELCEAAGAIKQSTRKGYHYVFRYTPLLRTRVGRGGAFLDVRNDKGLLYCEPSYYHLNAEQIFRYTWQNLPLDKERIPACPQEVIDAVSQILGDGVPHSQPEEAQLRRTERRAATELARTGLDLPSADEESLRTLLTHLDASHAENYQDWITVGLALHNSDAGWELFDEFSRRALDKYVEGEPWYVYSRFKDRSENQRVVTIATLYWWLRRENPEVFASLVASESRSEYDALKTEFERNNFYVKQNLCHLDDQGHLWPFQPSSARNYYANISLKHFNGKKMQETDFLSIWLKDPRRKSYDRVDFYPDADRCPSNVYNLFEGFEAEKHAFDLSAEERARLVAPILELVDAISGGHSGYFLSWLAHLLQHPGRKSEIALVLRDRIQKLFEAGGGTGKTLFLVWFGTKVLGKKYFLVVSDNNSLYDHFTELLEHMLLVYVEEADGVPNKKNENLLKARITSVVIDINKKGLSKYTVRDLARYIFTTNHSNPIPGYGASLSDRRFWFTDVNPRHRGDAEFFNELSSHMEKPEVAHAFYRFLLDHPTWETPIDFSNHRPMTSATIHIRFLNSGPIIQWLVHRIQNELPLEGSVKDLYSNFELWVAEEQPERNEPGRKLTRKYFMDQLTGNPDIMGAHDPTHVAYRTNRCGHLRLDRDLVRRKLLEGNYIMEDPRDLTNMLLASRNRSVCGGDAVAACSSGAVSSSGVR